jgi:RimJ/RimL family protein N-acetyltransferase
VSTTALEVRRLTAADIDPLVAYWTAPSPEHLARMGVDPAKLPGPEILRASLSRQIETPIPRRTAHCLIWVLDQRAVGHCNTNPTFFGDHAFMHLHMWDVGQRARGLGTAFVTASVRMFFADLKLRELFSQPYAKNPAPHRTLARVGFELDAELVTTPGPISFEQPIKRWRMTRARFDALA